MTGIFSVSWGPCFKLTARSVGTAFLGQEWLTSQHSLMIYAAKATNFSRKVKYLLVLDDDMRRNARLTTSKRRVRRAAAYPTHPRVCIFSEFSRPPKELCLIQKATHTARRKQRTPFLASKVDPNR